MEIVEFFSFRNAPVDLKAQWKDAIEKVIYSGVFIGGEEVDQFEEAWAKYLGVKYAIGVGNGYDAIFIALQSLNLKKNSYIGVPSHTFIATWLAISAAGLTPFGIDCDDRGLIDLDKLENCGVELAAVVAVHMHGQMVDMKRLTTWAIEKGVLIVEDCAQAHGASQEGRKAGSWGHLNAFSFYPTKNLGALGDAGAITTNDQALAERARKFAIYGTNRDNKYKHTSLGVNSRLDSMQAAILNVNLECLDHWNKRRIEIAKSYNNMIERIGIDFLSQSPFSVFHHYVVFSKKQNQSRGLLRENGIKTDIHYPESAEMSFRKIVNQKKSGSLPKRSIWFSTHAISLPIYPWMPERHMELMFQVLNKSEVLESFK